MKSTAKIAGPRLQCSSTVSAVFALLGICALSLFLAASSIRPSDSNAMESVSPGSAAAFAADAPGNSTGRASHMQTGDSGSFGPLLHEGDPPLLLKVRVSSPRHWEILRSLDAELYLRGDGYAVVKLHPQRLPALQSKGLQWRTLSYDVPGPLYLLFPEEGSPPVGSLDVLLLDEDSGGALVSATPEAASDARDKGYKAMPLKKPWPIRPEGFLDLDFIHDTVEPNPDYRWILGGVSPDSLGAFIKHLEDYGTRYAYSSQVVHAGEWILKRLWNYGCSDTVSQGVPVGGGKVQIGHSNVIGIKRGTTRPDFHILVGGHYDSISDAIGVGINRAPGADDNASGTAAALEIARLLVDVELDASVQFVLFSAEEQGMIGSSQFVAQLVQEGVPPEELFFINMDMIGNSVSVPWMVKVFYDNPSRPLAELLAAVGDAYTDVTAIMSGFTGRSDHAPFWSAGYPALFLHERDFSPHYHSVHDLLEYLNMDYEAEVVRMVLATVLHLANAADPPDAVTATETESGELYVEWSRSSDADVLGYHLEVLDEKGELTHKIFTKNTYAVLGPEDVPNGSVVRVRAEDVLGEGEASEAVLVDTGRLLASGATPNPTGGPCMFRVFVPGSGPSVKLSIKIVDASGRLVRLLGGGVVSRGAHTLEWDGELADGSRAPSGVYFYEVDAEGVGRESGRVMVVR